MKKSFSIVAMLTTLLFAVGCKPDPSGSYTITAVERSHYNTDIEDKLVKELYEQPFDLQFHDKRLRFKSIKTGELFTLYRTGVFGPHTIYECSSERHDTSYTFRITKDSTLRLEIYVNPPLDTAAIPKGPVNSTFAGVDYHHSGRVICQLVKN